MHVEHPDDGVFERHLVGIGRRAYGVERVTIAAARRESLARNIVLYAERGEIVLKPLDDDGRRGVLVIARDRGPGIPGDYRMATSGSARDGVGCHGLYGLSRLVDECVIISELGEGTTVELKKWQQRRAAESA